MTFLKSAVNEFAVESGVETKAWPGLQTPAELLFSKKHIVDSGPDLAVTISSSFVMSVEITIGSKKLIGAGESEERQTANLQPMTDGLTE